MKRTGYIYEKIYDSVNIKEAILKASLGKRNRGYVKKVLQNLDFYANKISKMLKSRTYVPSAYTIKKIKDGSSGKERTICKPQFYPDQIIHWALILQIQKIMMKGMYVYSCGSVPKRGTSLGQKMLRKWLDDDKAGTTYCLKLDISKYYPSIDNSILKKQFRKKIKDLNCLWLIDTIIDSHKGLPIGNYTSQWFANFFLQDVDHLIKEKLRVKYYIRYVDDLVILSSSKQHLHWVRKELSNYLKEISLSVKNDWQVFPIRCRAIDFLGLKFYQHKTTLRKRNALRIKRRIRKISKKSCLSYRDACAVVSYWGWICRSDSCYFYNKNLKSKISIIKARSVISHYGKTNQIRRTAHI